MDWLCGARSALDVVHSTAVEMQKEFPDYFPTTDMARIPAALLGALFACHLTHPFDTVKTCMQGDIERKTYGTFLQTARTIWNQHGLGGFYQGSTFRNARQVRAVFIMELMQEKVGMLLYPSAYGEMKLRTRPTTLSHTHGL